MFRTEPPHAIFPKIGRRPRFENHEASLPGLGVHRKLALAQTPLADAPAGELSAELTERMLAHLLKHTMRLSQARRSRNPQYS